MSRSSFYNCFSSCIPVRIDRRVGGEQGSFLTTPGGHAMATTPITRKGYEALTAELSRLRKEERPKVIEAIAEARAHGDLSENAEYDAAKERQGFIEARIAELQTKLAEARIIDTAGRVSDTVVFGATVVLIEQESQEKKQYTLVGQDEADLKLARISVQSPVGRALIGKRVGDLVEAQTPSRVVEYEVVEIRFEEL
jgi:transcription elongation factor GreA